MTGVDRKFASRIRAIGKSIEENADTIAAGTPQYTSGLKIEAELGFEQEELDIVHVSYSFIPEEETKGCCIVGRS